MRTFRNSVRFRHIRCPNSFDQPPCGNFYSVHILDWFRNHNNCTVISTSDIVKINSWFDIIKSGKNNLKNNYLNFLVFRFHALNSSTFTHSIGVELDIIFCLEKFFIFFVSFLKVFNNFSLFFSERGQRSDTKVNITRINMIAVFLLRLKNLSEFFFNFPFICMCDQK